MAITKLSNDEQEHVKEENLLTSLPKERGWRTSNLYLYQGFWCQPKEIQAIISFQTHFKGQNTDIILGTIPKSGTTWLKALVFSIVNRGCFPNNISHPLLTSNPHDLVPFLEYKLYANNRLPDLSELPSPRLFATHVPFASLPNSADGSGCRVVYLCRNPLDNFASAWHYVNNLRPTDLGPFMLDEAFDMYCRGVIGFGPYWDHMLGYYKESLEMPHKVLFLKYEDLQEDITFELKRLAQFLGFPFSEEEQREGVVEEIAKMCSFQELRELDVNKNGKSIANFENKHLFRKGEVGDWVNLLTPIMVERLSKIMKEKLGYSGLTFKVFSEKKI